MKDFPVEVALGSLSLSGEFIDVDPCANLSNGLCLLGGSVSREAPRFADYGDGYILVMREICTQSSGLPDFQDYVYDHG